MYSKTPMENFSVHSSNAKLFFPSLPVCAWRWIQIHRRPAIPSTFFYLNDNKHTPKHAELSKLKPWLAYRHWKKKKFAGCFKTTAASIPLRPSLGQPIWARLWQPCWYGRPWGKPGWPWRHGRGRNGWPGKSAGCHVPADAGDGSPWPRARYDGASSCRRTAKRWDCRDEEDAQILGSSVVEETERQLSRGLPISLCGMHQLAGEWCWKSFWDEETAFRTCWSKLLLVVLQPCCKSVYIEWNGEGGIVSEAWLVSSHLFSCTCLLHLFHVTYTTNFMVTVLPGQFIFQHFMSFMVWICHHLNSSFCVYQYLLFHFIFYHLIQINDSHPTLHQKMF